MLKLKTQLDIVKYSLWVKKISPLGGVEGGTGHPNVNLEPPKISETARVRMLKLKTQLDIVKYSFWVINFSARGRPGGVRPIMCKFGTPLIYRKVKETES